jgi:tetratricopeptide (TPR) repeat protein
MTALPTTAAVPSPRRPFWRRRLLWSLLVLLGLGAAGAAGGWIWYERRALAPLPPSPDLDGVDPPVAAAIEKERKAVLGSPRSAAAWGQLGKVLAAYYYHTEAIACFAQAERLDPREPRWPYFQGVFLLLDQAEEAIPCFRRALALCGDESDVVRLRLNETLLTQGHLDEAEDGFRRMLEREPGNPRVHLGLGRLAVQRQRWQEALSHLRTAAADRHTGRAVSIALAEVYQRQGDETAAADWRSRVEHLPPDAPWPDRWVEEIQQLHVGVSKRDRLIQAGQLLKQGRDGEAFTLFNQLVSDYPDSDEAWFALGQALYSRGNYAAAEQAMQKVVALTPGYAEAHNYLGLARFRQRNLPAAADAFRKATQLKPDFALAYANLARCLVQQKDEPGAVSAFRTAVRCKPDFVEVRLELAELLHRTGHDADALDEVRQALQLRPADPKAQGLLKQLEKTAPAPPR